MEALFTMGAQFLFRAPMVFEGAHGARGHPWREIISCRTVKQIALGRGNSSWTELIKRPQYQTIDKKLPMSPLLSRSIPKIEIDPHIFKVRHCVIVQAIPLRQVTRQ
jgi:hypothetical protein